MRTHETVKDEVERAKQELGLTDSDIRLLPDAEGFRVFSTALSQFVASGNRRWWWEDFNLPATRIGFPDSSLGLQLLVKIVPSAEDKVWLIIEDDQLPFFPVCEANTTIIQAVIGECYHHEYYIIAKDFSWLVCDTHHNEIIAIGQQVEANLRQYAI